MKIIFEDGTVIETEDPARKLTDVILNRTLAYKNNRWPDYIFVLRGYRNKDDWSQFSEVCVYLELEGYKWIRNWWEGFDTIQILYADTLLHAGNRLELDERTEMCRNGWPVI